MIAVEDDLFRVSVSGAGTRTVVLGNGFGTTQASWSRVLPWLEQRFRVVRFDWMTAPQHYDYTRYFSLEAYAADLLGVVARTGGAPCVFIGHSMSGMIGMLAGKARPEAFERMVMINPSPCYINGPGYVGGFSEDEVNGLLTALSDNYQTWVDGIAPLIVGDGASRQQVQEFAEGLLAMRPDVAFSMALTLFRSDLRAHLPGFAVPTTIVQSTRDVAVPVAVADYLCRAWPDCRVRLVDASGHLPHMTHAHLVIEALEEVL
ncbi:alpha/beta fold hydrolase [Novispirillum sp. DQ9]|uniref:alpha/beta fold hydrolase n=1 Tax=Novispirillum sp. DQ9 TaxID=3398612 RepID=UPI003C7E45E5